MIQVDFTWVIKATAVARAVLVCPNHDIIKATKATRAVLVCPNHGIIKATAVTRAVLVCPNDDIIHYSGYSSHKNSACVSKQ